MSAGDGRCRRRWRACSGAPPLSRAEKTEPNVGKPGVIVGQKGEREKSRIEELKSCIVESDSRIDCLHKWPKADDERTDAFRARPPMKWADECPRCRCRPEEEEEEEETWQEQEEEQYAAPAPLKPRTA